MWGVDYPHIEGSLPYPRLSTSGARSRACPRRGRRGWSRQPAELYGFDLGLLAPIADRLGPTMAEVAEPYPWSGVPEEAVPGLHAENQRELVS